MQKALVGSRNLDSQCLPAMPGVNCVFKDENWDFLPHTQVMGNPAPFYVSIGIESVFILARLRASSRITGGYGSLLGWVSYATCARPQAPKNLTSDGL